MPTCVELFAGAGGASVGLHRAGFRSLLAVEWDDEAHATLAAAGLSDRTANCDVRKMEIYDGLEGKVDLLWASPPCQAWSTAGKRLGAFDDRNGWPWTLDVVDKLRPRWVLCENVTGLINHQSGCPVVAGKARDGGALDLFQEDVDDSQVGLPPAEDCPGCYWERVVLPEFRKRYAHVDWEVVNSADYGVPQRRERVILMAGPENPGWPEKTHSLDRLAYEKFVDDSYWTLHHLPKVNRMSPAEKACNLLSVPRGAAWVTVHDVFSSLPPDASGYAGLWVQPHQLARTERFRKMLDGVVNPSDDESLWDLNLVAQTVAMNPHMPSDTVTCRRGGAKTNDALIWNDGGKLRYLTIPEVAAIQAFPSDHPWQGSKSAKYKQVGNAVPPPVAEVLGKVVAARLP
jgi:DNA (cytosine-5)-methyltransferase 1